MFGFVEFEGVEILAAEVRPEKEAGWTRVSEETAVPTRIEATVYMASPLLRLDLKIWVDWAGRGLVHQMTVLTDSPQTGINITLLRRIPVDTLMRYAMAQSSVPIRLRPDIAPGGFQLKHEPENGTAWVSAGPLEPGRGRDAQPDRILQAAEIFKDAQARGHRSPVEAVVNALHYSRATAQRDLKEARKRGLIPPVSRSDAKPTEERVITGTGRVVTMSAEDFNHAAQELGVHGPGPKGKRLSELTPDEFAAIAERFATEVKAKYPGETQEEFLEAQREAGHQVTENRRPNDDDGPL